MPCLTSGGVFKDTASLSVLLGLMSPKGRNGNHLNQIKMTKDYQQMMEELFVVYYEQCPTARIKYAIYDPTKTQGHIVLDNWIEIIHFTNYQGGYAIKFAIQRDNEEYFFDTYADAVKYSSMPLYEFFNYVLSITV